MNLNEIEVTINSSNVIKYFMVVVLLEICCCVNIKSVLLFYL